MGNNRYNQNRGDKIPDYTPREERKKAIEASAKQLEPTVVLKPCHVCNKTITTGYYGTHQNGGTCSKKCEVELALRVIESFGEIHENATMVTAFNGNIFNPSKDS